MDLILFITYPKGMLQVLSLLSADEERAVERTFGRVENCTYSHEGKAKKNQFSCQILLLTLKERCQS